MRLKKAYTTLAGSVVNPIEEPEISADEAEEEEQGFLPKKKKKKRKTLPAGKSTYFKKGVKRYGEQLDEVFKY